jgi:hypothetical protein
MRLWRVFCLLGDSGQDVLSNEHATRKRVRSPPLDSNLHSLSRQLIELRIEHADLDATIDRLAEASPQDELLLRRLKKRRLALRDQITRLENMLDPKEPA